MNLYGFVGNDGVDFTDYLGLQDFYEDGDTLDSYFPSKCCLATREQIYDKINKGGRESVRRSKEDQEARHEVLLKAHRSEQEKWKGKLPTPSKPPRSEYGGRVCCKGTELKLSNLVTSGTPESVALSESRCDAGWLTVGLFHNHLTTTLSPRDRKQARDGKANRIVTRKDGTKVPVYEEGKDSTPPMIPIGRTMPTGEDKYDTDIHDPVLPAHARNFDYSSD